jgi:hypothetical protein
MIAILGVLSSLPALAQPEQSPQELRTKKFQKRTAAAVQAQQQFATVEPAQQIKSQFENLLNRYPPNLRRVFKADPGLLTQEEYLAPYPALVNFLNAHPEIALDPAFYLDGLASENQTPPMDRFGRAYNMWENLMRDLEVFAGFGIAIGLLTWLIRTFLDYRRWNRLSKVQTEVHTRLLDRFSTNEELMAYIATPAGSKFLQSAPISLDTGTRGMGAPLNRIMWSLQAGLVLCAAGCGLMLASSRVGEDAYLPLEIMGILALALGVGFAVSAAVSFLLSQRMGLLDASLPKRSPDPQEPQH